MRTASCRISAITGGRPGPRRLWPSYFRLPNPGHHRRSSRSAAALAVIFPGNEPPMPCQERVRAHDGADFLEHAPPQVLRFGGQADALIVGEAQPTRAE